MEEILNSPDKLKLYLDTNILIAYLDKSHKFNYEAASIIEPLKDRECWFFVNTIVVGEFIDQWRKLKKVSINNSIHTLINFMDNVLKHCLRGGSPINLDHVFSSYKKHSKHTKLLKVPFNDFLILNEAESIKNIKVITCDHGMFSAGKNILKKNIYYLPFKTKKGKSDLGRLIEDIGNLNI